MASAVYDNNSISQVVKYQKLPPGSVRMMLLAAGDPDEPLRAWLETIDLKSVGDDFIYNALSYTYSYNHQAWDCPMSLDDQPIMVTKQLSELFREVRTTISKGWCSRWWIDQICINQADDEDKAQQILHMRAVYERANYVTIWLRPGLPEHNEPLVQLVIRLISLSKRSGSGHGLDRMPVSVILGPPTEENFQSWRALKELMNHGYWTRTWILAEACARLDHSVVTCGSIDDGFELSYVFTIRNILRKLAARQAECPPEHPVHDIHSALVGRLENFHLLRTSKTRRMPLFEILFLTRRTECRYQQDKIFSVLSFADDVGDYENDKLLKPSYAWGPQVTFSHLIKWYVLKYRNLDFLGYCTATKDDTAQVPGFDLPSWVPNWSHASYMRPLWKYRNPLAPTEDRVRTYNACGRYSGSIDEIVEPPSDEYWSTSLFSSGIRVATIHKVLDSVPENSTWDASIELSWKSEFDANTEYALTKESYLDAYERTVVADVFHNADNTISRPGKARWWHDNPDIDPSDLTEREFQMKTATLERTLFFASSSPLPPNNKNNNNNNNNSNKEHSSDTSTAKIKHSGSHLASNCKSFLMGLGRCDIAIGDEIWALKGGQVLYVLRDRKETIVFHNTREAREPGQSSIPNVLWMNGRSYPWDDGILAKGLSFVGECYVHGLMDGEVLEFASTPAEERPEMLRDMAQDFEEIFIGGCFSEVF